MYGIKCPGGLTTGNIHITRDGLMAQVTLQEGINFGGLKHFKGRDSLEVTLQEEIYMSRLKYFK